MAKRDKTPGALQMLSDLQSRRVPPPAAGDPPEWLSETAKAHWHRLAPVLLERGQLTVADVDAFTVVCNALARYRQATEMLDKSSLLVKVDGALVRNPLLSVQAEAERTLATYGARFGIVPTAL